MPASRSRRSVASRGETRTHGASGGRERLAVPLRSGGAHREFPPTALPAVGRRWGPEAHRDSRSVGSGGYGGPGYGRAGYGDGYDP